MGELTGGNSVSEWRLGHAIPPAFSWVDSSGAGQEDEVKERWPMREEPWRLHPYLYLKCTSPQVHQRDLNFFFSKRQYKDGNHELSWAVGLGNPDMNFCDPIELFLCWYIVWNLNEEKNDFFAWTQI